MTDTSLLERTDVIVEEDLDEKIDDGDEASRFSHLAKKDDIDNAILNATVCTAICGFTWHPAMVPPKSKPVCPKCRDLYENANWKPHGPEDGEPPL